MLKIKLPLLLFFMVLGASMTHAQMVRKPFKGFYIGAESGYQYLYSTASVNNSTDLQDGTLMVATGLVGWRDETNSHLVYGAEFQIGQPFGGYANDGIDGQTLVVYEHGLQWALQVAMGKDFLRNHLFMYVGANQSTYTSKVPSTTSGFIEQKGDHSFARLGMGLERDLAAGFTARITVGTSIDGEQSTNNGVDAKFGLLFNF